MARSQAVIGVPGQAQTETLTVAGVDLAEKVRDLLERDDISRITIKQQEHVVFDIPVVSGAIDSELDRALTAIAVVGCLVPDCTIEIVRARC